MQRSEKNYMFCKYVQLQINSSSFVTDDSVVIVYEKDIQEMYVFHHLQSMMYE